MTTRTNPAAKSGSSGMDNLDRGDDEKSGSSGMDNLPDEMVAHVVRRLPPRSLATCRGVCKDWRAVVDACGLLVAAAHLVPRSLGGIFVNHIGKETHSFFSRGASPVDHALSFLPDRRMCDTSQVLDHRNGLLLYQNRTKLLVCNPATRRCAALPPPPPTLDRQRFYRHRLYLMFDPTVSLHYDVWYFPEVPEKPKPYPEPEQGRSNGRSTIVIRRYSYDKLPAAVREAYEHDLNTIGSMEWPPLSYALQVYSSRTGQWEERRFTREEGSTVLTVSDVWSDPPAPSNRGMLRCHAVYWRGAFHVHCRGGFLMRFSLLEGKCVVIKTPRLDISPRLSTSHTDGHEKPTKHLAKSKYGVYYTSIHQYHLRVWILRQVSKSCQMPEWELKYQHDLEPSFLRHQRNKQTAANSWILDPVEDNQGHEWDSDDDCTADSEQETDYSNKGSTFSYSGVDILGYHPFKEIIFLGNRFRGYAYYLGSSKLQYLGSLYPAGLRHFPLMTPTLESFIYTPCMEDLLYAQNNPS